MRLSAFAITPLVIASAAFARSSTHSRIHKRAPHLTDVCAYLTTGLQFSDVRENGKPYMAGHLDSTVCLSQVEAFIKGNEVAQEAIKVVGEHKVEVTLNAMIQDSGTECSYPHHSMPSATSSNLCNFKCTDGFLPTPVNHPTTCECPSHLTECDGKCGHFHPEQCPKTSSPSRRQTEPKCSSGLQLCGANTNKGWECADVKVSTSNCGGCAKESPFGGSVTHGVNCNEIPNVKEVFCSDRRCIVEECKADYVATSAKNSCIPIPKGPETRRLESPLDPASAAASVIKGKGNRRSNSQAGIAHGESLDTPLSSAKGISAAGIQSKPEETVGGLIHNSKLDVPGVGSLSTSTKAGFQVNHRSVPVPNGPPSKSTEGLIAAGKLSPAGSAVGQFSQGGAHSTNGGVQVPSPRGVTPMTLTHPRGGAPKLSTPNGGGVVRDIPDEDIDANGLPAGEALSGAQ